MKRLLSAEMKAKFDDMAQRFAQLERQWEASEHRDKNALRGMLIHWRPIMPEVLFTGLIETLTPRRAIHYLRHEMVKAELEQNPTLRVRQACERVSTKLAKTTSRGKAPTIERSFYKIKKQTARQAQRQCRKRQPSNLTVSKG